jgi:hypothetical protein
MPGFGRSALWGTTASSQTHPQNTRFPAKDHKIGCLGNIGDVKRIRPPLIFTSLGKISLGAKRDQFVGYDYFDIFYRRPLAIG